MYHKPLVLLYKPRLPATIRLCSATAPCASSHATYVWFHWTWLLQAQLTRAYQPPLEKTMDVCVSVKVIGPFCVKGLGRGRRVGGPVMLVEPE